MKWTPKTVSCISIAQKYPKMLKTWWDAQEKVNVISQAVKSLLFYPKMSGNRMRGVKHWHLQLTLFNQPWDFSANQLKKCLLHLHRCCLVLCATPREWGAAHREKQSCPNNDVVSHHRDTNLLICCLCPCVKTDRSSNSKSGHLSEDTFLEVFFELPHSTTNTTTKDTQRFVHDVFCKYPQWSDLANVL